jgi:hypothetical protein
MSLRFLCRNSWINNPPRLWQRNTTRPVGTSGPTADGHHPGAGVPPLPDPADAYPGTRTGEREKKKRQVICAGGGSPARSRSKKGSWLAPCAIAGSAQHAQRPGLGAAGSDWHDVIRGLVVGGDERRAKCLWSWSRGGPSERAGFWPEGPISTHGRPFDGTSCVEMLTGPVDIPAGAHPATTTDAGSGR